MSHATVRERLMELADGTLPAEERRKVEAHLLACGWCATDLADFRRLNEVLGILPVAPPVAFAPFWLKLKARLPATAGPGAPWFSRRPRLALAFAVAALAALAASATAFASESALPNSPLYPLKHAQEELRLALTPDPQARLEVQVQLAGERLREAQVMAATSNEKLALASLEDFQALVRHADGRLSEDRLDAMRLELSAVEQAAEQRGGHDRLLKASIGRAVALLTKDARAAGEDDLKPAVTPTPEPEATPTASVTPTPEPEPTPTATPQPRPSATPEPPEGGHDGGGHH